MSESTQLFTSASLQTFIAAGFILALMGTGIATYNMTRTGQVESAIIDLRIEQTRMTEAETHYRTRIAELEARLVTVEARPTHSHLDAATP